MPSNDPVLSAPKTGADFRRPGRSFHRNCVRRSSAAARKSQSMSHPDDLGEVCWLVTLEDPADIPPGADADEFIHHLTTAASEHFEATGMRAAGSNEPFPHYAWRLTGCNSQSQLWIARSDHELHF